LVRKRTEPRNSVEPGRQLMQRRKLPAVELIVAATRAVSGQLHSCGPLGWICPYGEAAMSWACRQICGSEDERFAG
jgi:hypothetical protein